MCYHVSNSPTLLSTVGYAYMFIFLFTNFGIGTNKN